MFKSIICTFIESIVVDGCNDVTPAVAVAVAEDEDDEEDDDVDADANEDTEFIIPLADDTT
jgi:hypothetical protein